MALAALMPGALAQRAVVSIADQPVFFSCTASIPVPQSAPPAMAPMLNGRMANFLRGNCGAGTSFSGKFLMVDIIDPATIGFVPPNLNVVQHVMDDSTTLYFDPETQKCDLEDKYEADFPEVFENIPNLPTRDHHATMLCCRSIFRQKVAVTTSIMNAPLGAVFRDGWRVADFPKDRDFGRAIALVNALPGATWAYDYRYDGCNTPPRTPTQTRHYLKLEISYPGGPSGASVWTGK